MEVKVRQRFYCNINGIKVEVDNAETFKEADFQNTMKKGV